MSQVAADGSLSDLKQWEKKDNLLRALYGLSDCWIAVV